MKIRRYENLYAKFLYIAQDNGNQISIEYNKGSKTYQVSLLTRYYCTRSKVFNNAYKAMQFFKLLKKELKHV